MTWPETRVWFLYTREFYAGVGLVEHLYAIMHVRCNDGFLFSCPLHKVLTIPFHFEKNILICGKLCKASTSTLVLREDYEF